MTKKYTLTTSEETVTENPEDIIRLMKLAGLKDAQPVAEEEVTEEVEAEVYEPTEANDELDLDDYSKKSPESINKQKKSIQPTLGDNPLEYSLDENEIYEAMMKEFNELEESKPDFLDLDKDGDKEESMKKAAKDKKEKADESVEEVVETEELNEIGRTLEDEKARLARLEKQQEKMKHDEMEVKRLQDIIDQAKKNIANNMNEGTDGCGCGHGSDCNCGPDCDCGCNESVIKEDKSMTDGTIKKLQYLEDTNYDVYEEMGDIFGMFGSPYTADDWLSHMKLTIDEVFTKEGSPVPPEVAKVYNDLEAYSKQTELQAKRRANTEISNPNDAIYGPENEDEVYIRDNFAEQWYGAFYKVTQRLGLEQNEDFDESSDMDRLKKLSGVERESQINEDESVWNQFKELHDKMDPESEDRIFFSMKNYPKHRFEIHGDIDGKDTKSGNVNVGVFLDQQTDNGDDFLQNMSISQDEIKANITGAGWVGADPAKGELKGTAGDYKEFGDVKPEPKDTDQDRLAKLSGINASKKYY